MVTSVVVRNAAGVNYQAFIDAFEDVDPFTAAFTPVSSTSFTLDLGNGLTGVFTGVFQGSQLINASGPINKVEFFTNTTLEVDAVGMTFTIEEIRNAIAAGGTALQDVLLDDPFDYFGNAGQDLFVGGYRDDTMRGGASNDALAGGLGNDRIQGGAGNDVLDGGDGNDLADYSDKTGAINAQLNGPGPIPVLIDISLDPTVQNFQTEEAIANFEGLIGGSGNDFLTGDGGLNILLGGNGNDRLLGAGGNDLINGGDGTGDIADYSDKGVSVVATIGVSFTVSVGGLIEEQVINVESLQGGNGDDTLSGDGNANFLGGGNGIDRLIGGGGADTLNGGGGTDTFLQGGVTKGGLQGNAGNDVYVNPLSAEVNESAAQGFDTVLTDSSFSLATLGNVERGELTGATPSFLRGNQFANQLVGNAGSNTMTGFDGNDVIFSASGRDTIIGGLGRDEIHPGLERDQIRFDSVAESTGATCDLVFDFVFTNGGALYESLDFTVIPTAIRTTVTAGNISNATFDADLSAAVGAGQLGIGQAVMFDPTGGDRGGAGRVFLVVDANGVAGYQGGQDYVVEFISPFYGNLQLGNFV